MKICKDFLNQYNYDLRISKDGRWIDQKCCFDVLNIVADCIIQYCDSSSCQEFTFSNIQHSEYTSNNVIQIFSKPDPNKEAQNEYDKYFAQPMKLLIYSKVLNAVKRKNTYYCTINNREILEWIALRPKNAFDFLHDYIFKVLTDSGLMNTFENFFDKQDNFTYREVRNQFIEFTRNNSKINGKKECGRIFAKVLNTLAFALQKRGTDRGRISKTSITLDMIQYNRINERDKRSGKEKNVTRLEHEANNSQIEMSQYTKYSIKQAKDNLKKINDEFYNRKSEILDPNETVDATQVHHIFSQSEYLTIADCVENLIVLTPNQHFAMAHPQNNTQYIDRDFQYLCLIAKTIKIYESFSFPDKSQIYSFEQYINVLNTGLKTDDFSNVDDMDFESIINKIDYFYRDCISTNKYSHLVKLNKITCD